MNTTKNQYLSRVIIFPNAKINLGLYITEKRPDGFHNIETTFYPVGWCDVLEVIENNHSPVPFKLNLSGLNVQGNEDDNILYKTWQLIQKKYMLPNLNVYLHKVIPMGAGLGGGSSDAAFFIQLLDQKFNLNIPNHEKINMARSLGSDCAFFIENKPVFASEKGDVFESLNLNLDQYHLLIIYPKLHSDTKLAYSQVRPKKPNVNLKYFLEQHSVQQWKDVIQNDFENSLFHQYPLIQDIKEKLYAEGALYASMSGSGSAVFGIFENIPELNWVNEFPHWSGSLKM